MRCPPAAWRSRRLRSPRGASLPSPGPKAEPLALAVAKWCVWHPRKAARQQLPRVARQNNFASQPREL